MKHHMSVSQWQAWILGWPRLMVLAHTPLQCLGENLSISVASEALLYIHAPRLEHCRIRDIISGDL
jgi:hypothetical protein